MSKSSAATLAGEGQRANHTTGATDEPENELPDEALAAIRVLLEEIASKLPELTLSNVTKAEVHADVTQITAEVERPTPRTRFMKIYLESLRDNLAKPAGLGTATALVTAVGAILAKYFGVGRNRC